MQSGSKYIILVMDASAEFYSKPSYHYQGVGFPVYSGSRRQRGGGILGAIKSFFMPILKSFGKKALVKGKSAAIGFAKDMITDKIMGRDMKESFKKNATNRALRLGKDLVTEGAETVRTATKRRAKTRTSNKAIKRTSRGAGFSRKRRASSAFTQRKKRRRLNPHRHLKRKIKRRVKRRVKRRRRNF